MFTKRFDRKGRWGEHTATRYRQRVFLGGGFTGPMGLLQFDRVAVPLQWRHAGRPVRVCDTGMKWLQYIPQDEQYAVCAVFDIDDSINLWYLDVIAGWGYASDKVVYFTSLYVDSILYPDGAYLTDDTDEELREALLRRDITPELYRQALTTKARLATGLARDRLALTSFCVGHLAKMQDAPLE